MKRITTERLTELINTFSEPLPSPVARLQEAIDTDICLALYELLDRRTEDSDPRHRQTR
jgi:hypothetical protein